MKKDDDHSSIQWHDFSIKELLELSKQNEWTDVHQDITSLILSLSKYSSLKAAKSSPPSDQSLAVNAFLEKGTQGLWYVKYADYMDGSDGNDEMDAHEDHVELINKFVSFIYSKSSHVIKSIENECGHRVHLNGSNREQWSFWICALIYVVKQNQSTSNWIKHAMHTQSTMDRIKSCYDVLKPQAHIWNQ